MKMMSNHSFRLVILVAGIGVVYASPNLQGTIYNAAADFSSSNPSGPWSYGYQSAKIPFHLHETYDPEYIAWKYGPVPLWGIDGCIAKNVGPCTDEFDHDGLWMSPGGNTDEVLRWTAPSSGSFNVDYFFYNRGGAHPTVTITILHNDSTIASGSLWGTGIFSWGGQRDVVCNAGDFIDVVVCAAGTNEADSTPFNLTISSVPEPATIGLLAMGMLMVLRRRVRRSA